MDCLSCLFSFMRFPSSFCGRFFVVYRLNDKIRYEFWAFVSLDGEIYQFSDRNRGSAGIAIGRDRSQSRCPRCRNIAQPRCCNRRYISTFNSMKYLARKTVNILISSKQNYPAKAVISLHLLMGIFVEPQERGIKNRDNIRRCVTAHNAPPLGASALWSRRKAGAVPAVSGATLSAAI